MRRVNEEEKSKKKRNARERGRIQMGVLSQDPLKKVRKDKGVWGS
jgi:hypothetical protein